MTKVRLQAEERRVAIVEAAKPLFARHGFAGTTTKEIARAAGVSEALMFQHFPSKAALYREILLLGCDGDPGLDHLGELEPSTASLVAMVHLMLQHVVLGALDETCDKEVQDRLTLHSLVEDGEYVRLVSEWMVERILPKFLACHQAAARAGDLRPGSGRAENAFWFGFHSAQMTAFGRLGERPAYPYAGPFDDVALDLARFVLRGIGLEDRAIEAHLDPAALRPLQAEPAAPTAAAE
jgi:TetR/AcrR family transcriptional regulator, transcriptional repressor of aconitase